MNQPSERVQDIDRGKRLKAERARLGLSQSEIAKNVGVSKSSQVLYEKGNPPAADYLAAIIELGVDIFFVLTGKRGEDITPRPGTSVRKQDGTVLKVYEGEPQSEADRNPPGDDLISLPFYQDVAASAGPGAISPSDHADSVIAFGRSFLRDQGAVPEKCSVIWARGDSMAPTIPDASLLIVDLSQAEIANGCIMVINIGEDLLVKRIRRRLDGLVDLISDNPAYPPETIGPDMMRQLRVVGRVVYFCRTP